MSSSSSLVLLLLSFKDVNKVEKEEIRGIRTRTWIETKQSLLEDGFPYMVSAPALVVTIFMVFIPVATTILLSFTGMDPKHQAKFGWEALKNYKKYIQMTKFYLLQEQINLDLNGCKEKNLSEILDT